MEEIIAELLKRETGPNQLTQLAARLGLSEDYVRQLAEGKYAPGWRLARDINALYNKEEENA